LSRKEGLAMKAFRQWLMGPAIAAPTISAELSNIGPRRLGGRIPTAANQLSPMPGVIG
jgi:hypothetical protein